MILINITVQSPHVTVITWYKVLQDEIRRIAVIIDFGNRIRQFNLRVNRKRLFAAFKANVQPFNGISRLECYWKFKRCRDGCVAFIHWLGDNFGCRIWQMILFADLIEALLTIQALQQFIINIWADEPLAQLILMFGNKLGIGVPASD